MTKTFTPGLLSPKIRFNKIKKFYSLKQLKDEEGFTLVELIVVVMMIGILSSIAIPQFMTAADKAKQKEATGIVAALVKGATAFQTEYGALPDDAEDLSEYAKFQQCTDPDAREDGGAACKKDGDEEPTVGPVVGDATSFVTTSGNYFVEFRQEPGTAGEDDEIATTLFQVRANPNGGAYANNGSAVMGCYNPVDGVSEVYEYTAKTAEKGVKDTWRDC